MSRLKTYSELKTIETYEERFEYLLMGGHIGIETFGFDRYLNQVFYKSPEWRSLRNKVILRDNGNDLGLDGYPIFGKVTIHHMNPITAEDVIKRKSEIFDPEFLICVSHQTHNAIHYGNSEYPKSFQVIERKPNDTIPWR